MSSARPLTVLPALQHSPKVDALWDGADHVILEGCDEIRTFIAHLFHMGFRWRKGYKPSEQRLTPNEGGDELCDDAAPGIEVDIVSRSGSQSGDRPVVYIQSHSPYGIGCDARASFGTWKYVKDDPRGRYENMPEGLVSVLVQVNP